MSASLAVCLVPGLASGNAHAAEGSNSRRAAQQAEAERRLQQLRQDIATLTNARDTLLGERDSAARALREADQTVAQESRALQQIDADVAAQEAELAQLQQRRDTLQQHLARQRQALARLLRSAYALGRHEQLKLLLAQDRIESLARVMAYHRYLQKNRVTQIQTLSTQMQALTRLQQAIIEQQARLQASRMQQQARLAELDDQRQTRRQLLTELERRFSDTGARLAALGRDEQAVSALLERLRDIFADIPKQPDAIRPFAQHKGRLPRPIAGKTLAGFGASLPDGRSSRGWLIQARSGAEIKAIAHGRVAFSDWLKGYGLIIILDHGEGWMSLYAHADSLQREAGDWVAPGEVLAHAGASGGLDEPALYFELRRHGRPLDPHGWFK